MNKRVSERKSELEREGKGGGRETGGMAARWRVVAGSGTSLDSSPNSSQRMPASHA